MKANPEQEEDFRSVLEFASNGVADALVCMILASTYFHLFDDIVDREVELTGENLVECNNVFLRLLNNPFFDKYRSVLSCQIVLIGDDYITSTKQPDKYDFLRHNGHNFIRLVALLCGGEPRMVEVGRELRRLTEVKETIKKTI